MASTSYQDVVAGRVREDEGIGFFKNNQVATPARVTAFNPAQAVADPTTLSKDNLGHEGIGKTGTSPDNAQGYGAGSYNVD